MSKDYTKYTKISSQKEWVWLFAQKYALGENICSDTDTSQRPQNAPGSTKRDKHRQSYRKGKKGQKNYKNINK